MKISFSQGKKSMVPMVGREVAKLHGLWSGSPVAPHHPVGSLAWGASLWGDSGSGCRGCVGATTACGAGSQHPHPPLIWRSMLPVDPCAVPCAAPQLSITLSGEQRCEQSSGFVLPDPLQTAWGRRSQQMGRERLSVAPSFPPAHPVLAVGMF